MTLDPILTAPAAIQFHAAAAMITIVTTLLIFTRARGSRMHKRLGWVWVVSMGLVAVSSFWITTGGPVWGYGWIHLLSIYVLAGMAYAIWQIRRGRVASHRGMMLGLVWGGLVIAGGFTLLPGRIMHATLIGG